ncbi:MAG: TetR/AcrR family transcriptional regulator [Chloroflexaceae bacterium]|nr:TetR/AcrR family transcriptional regulator [Chloroflexaceae bacterium]
MSKGEQTREHILQRAAEVFSERGFFGTSMNDLVRATGLEKGGIYNHFRSKEQLALEAFDYSYWLVSHRIKTAVQAADLPIERLRAFVAAFASQVEQPLLPGGCPVLNTAVEADDAHPALRERVYGVVQEWTGLLAEMVRDGQAQGGVTARRGAGDGSNRGGGGA